MLQLQPRLYLYSRRLPEVKYSVIRLTQCCSVSSQHL